MATLPLSDHVARRSARDLSLEENKHSPHPFPSVLKGRPLLPLSSSSLPIPTLICHCCIHVVLGVRGASAQSSWVAQEHGRSVHTPYLLPQGVPLSLGAGVGRGNLPFPAIVLGSEQSPHSPAGVGQELPWPWNSTSSNRQGLGIRGEGRGQRHACEQRGRKGTVLTFPGTSVLAVLPAGGGGRYRVRRLRWGVQPATAAVLGAATTPCFIKSWICFCAYHGFWGHIYNTHLSKLNQTTLARLKLKISNKVYKSRVHPSSFRKHKRRNYCSMQLEKHPVLGCKQSTSRDKS